MIGKVPVKELLFSNCHKELEEKFEKLFPIRYLPAVITRPVWAFNVDMDFEKDILKFSTMEGHSYKISIANAKVISNEFSKKTQVSYTERFLSYEDEFLKSKYLVAIWKSTSKRLKLRSPKAMSLKLAVKNSIVALRCTIYSTLSY